MTTTTAQSSEALHPIRVLWAVPRSISTAFERMMIERGVHTVFDEPFSAAYYHGPERVSDRFPTTMADASYATVRARLTAAAHDRPVFIKDMASHARPVLDAGLLARFESSFLVRDPRRAVASMAQFWPDLTEEEAGFAPLLAAHRLATEVTGRTPPVIFASDLLADPPGVIQSWCAEVGLAFDPGALTWEPGMVDQWQLWGDWYRGAAASAGFDTPTEADPPEIDDPRLAGIVERAMPVIEKLSPHRLLPV